MIVMGSGRKTEFVRVIDPMWLVNLSESGNDVLFSNDGLILKITILLCNSNMLFVFIMRSGFIVHVCSSRCLFNVIGVYIKV